MRIGIDISQLAFENTGVANYLGQLVEHLVTLDAENEYILFYSSLRKELPSHYSRFFENAKNVKLKTFKYPPIFLELLWNRLHIMPIESFIGKVDVFLSSDWVQPPSKARKATILYDLIVYTYPEETHNRTNFSLRNFIFSANIVASQKRRLKWVKREVDKIICISEATKRDAMKILHIPEEKLSVIYPGF